MQERVGKNDKMGRKNERQGKEGKSYGMGRKLSAHVGLNSVCSRQTAHCRPTRRTDVTAHILAHTSCGVAYARWRCPY